MKKKIKFSLKIFFILSLSCSCLLYGYFRYSQQQFFKNIRQAKSLTPKQARFLVASSAKDKKYLNLNGLTQLDKETAKIISQFKGEALFLNGLTKIDPFAAKSLVAFKGRYLYLKKLKGNTLLHRVLLRWNQEVIRLDKVNCLDKNIAYMLSKFKGDLIFLSDLTELDEATAKILIRFKGSMLGVDGLRKLKKATLKTLVRFKGSYLSLDGIPRLNVEIAKVLIQFDDILLVRELRGNSILHQIFWQWNDEELKLKELKILDKDIALILAKYSGWKIMLNEVKALDGEAAKVIVQARANYICLNGLTKIDVKSAKAFAEFENAIELKGLTSIDKATAKALSFCRGWLYVPEKIENEIDAFR